MQFRKRSCNAGLGSYKHFCAQAQSKRVFTIQASMKKANRLARFDD